MAKKTLASSEYMKIRRYVLLLARKNGGKSVRLPTNQELADQFKVSRPTVMKAVQALVRDGFITGRRGIGTFTNPGRLFSWKIKNVGLLYGDGMYVWYDSFSSRFFGGIMTGLSNLNCVTQVLHLNSGTPEELAEELKFQNFDALVCVHASDTIRKILKKFPETQKRTLLVNENNPDFHCVSMDFDKLGYELGKRLIADGCVNPVLPFDKAPWNAPFDGFVRAWREAGFTLGKTHFTGYRPEDFTSALRKARENGKMFDTVFMAPAHPEQLGEILAGTEYDPSKIRIVCANMNNTIPPYFRGYTYSFPFEETATELAKAVSRILENPERKTEHTQIPFQYKKIEG